MLYDLLLTRRSIRKYQDKEIEKEKIDKILNGALLSPSSKSRRPWEFVVVTDKKILGELSECRGASSGFLKDAALGIVVIADEELCDVWIEDCSIATIIAQLVAHSEGLGSCWIQVRDRIHNEKVSAKEYVKKVLDIPSKYSVESIIAIGYPAEEKRSYKEDELLYEKLHFNKF